MNINSTFTLNTGVKIPRVQMGTWQINNDEVRKTVQKAISIGYRAFDTASDYGNEAGVGRGIWNSDIERSDLFLTTKIPTAVKNYRGTKKAIDDALEKFSLDYIDLLLIHSPQPWIEVNRTSDRYFEGNLENWRAMEEAVKAGKVRTIGVSNFLKEDIANILTNGTMFPAVNQINVNLGNTPRNLINYCEGKGILVEAYSPLANGKLLNNPIILKYASKYSVSPAQFMLRYVFQLDCIVISKTTKISEMKQNLALDFEISQADMDNLVKLKI